MAVTFVGYNFSQDRFVTCHSLLLTTMEGGSDKFLETNLNIQEAATSGIQSAHQVLNILTKQNHQCSYDKIQQHFSLATQETLYEFRRVVFLLGRTDHAKVRKGPLLPESGNEKAFMDSLTTVNPHACASMFSPSPSDLAILRKVKQFQPSSAVDTNLNQRQRVSSHQLQTPPPHFSPQAEFLLRNNNMNLENSITRSSTKSFMSSVSMDSSVDNQNDRCINMTQFTPLSVSKELTPVFYSKRKCPYPGKTDESGGKYGSIAGCHCSKRRKYRIKRTIRVPAISNKLADIPPDDYSWRKYGQKPIKGSPHPSPSYLKDLIEKSFYRIRVSLLCSKTGMGYIGGKRSTWLLLLLRFEVIFVVSFPSSVSAHPVSRTALRPFYTHSCTALLSS